MIEVSNLSFTYSGKTEPAVDGLHFRVERGEIFGFLGPNGAGKSTTQKILIGLLHGYSGSARVLDHDLADWGSDYYEHIGVAFEFPNHYLKLTGLENLAYFKALYRQPTREPDELLERVGLSGDGHVRVGQYSKGMKSRLSIARSLIGSPRVLFLDEPTSGLDPASARNIRQLIRELAADGMTVFLTTHDMTVADDLCDRVAFIVSGRLAVVEAPRTLKLAHGERRLRVEWRTSEGVQARDFPMEGLGSNQEFLERLRSSDELLALHTLEASLEDIFIEVTGASLS